MTNTRSGIVFQAITSKIPSLSTPLLLGREPTAPVDGKAPSSEDHEEPWRSSAAVAFAPVGKTIATAGLDGVVRTWDAVTGKKRSEVGVGSGAVWGLAFADAGRKLLTAATGAAVWDGTTERRLFDLRDGKPTPLTAIAVSPDGTAVAACGLDGQVRVWDLGTGRLSYRVSAGVGAVWAVAFTPDGRHVLTGGGGVYHNGDYIAGDRFTIRMWAVEPGRR